ncbi:uncharacterized protein METZ01_LOCUS203231 [marine metagenome]|uniref:SlyX protein n=1 Tax=marine metagenome TaxID=408172 RepID=A0A382EKI2_9ZZZZ
MTLETDRLVKIESALAHMENLTEALNETIIAQDKTIRRLTQQVEQMNDAIQAKEVDAIKGNVTKPPHYQ